MGSLPIGSGHQAQAASRQPCYAWVTDRAEAHRSGPVLAAQREPECVSSLLCASLGGEGGCSLTWRSEMSIFSRTLNFWPRSRGLGTQ